jgi:UDP-N-acetylmuramyl pentapeptide phosphotransferase/UDP-N-acetylglucosamine-1-phosphate transferase
MLFEALGETSKRGLIFLILLYLEFSMYLIVTSNSYSNKSILMYLVGACLGFLVSNKLNKKIVRNRQGLS